jgi:hypothetical protein
MSDQGGFVPVAADVVVGELGAHVAKVGAGHDVTSAGVAQLAADDVSLRSML